MPCKLDWRQDWQQAFWSDKCLPYTCSVPGTHSAFKLPLSLEGQVDSVKSYYYRDLQVRAVCQRVSRSLNRKEELEAEQGDLRVFHFWDGILSIKGGNTFAFSSLRGTCVHPWHYPWTWWKKLNHSLWPAVHLKFGLYAVLHATS